MHRAYAAEVRWEWVNLNGSWYEVQYQPLYDHRIRMDYRFTNGKFQQVHLPFQNDTWTIDIEYWDDPGNETTFSARKWGIDRRPWSDQQEDDDSVNVTDGYKYITTSYLVAPNRDTHWDVENDNPLVETLMVGNKLYACVIPGAIDGYVTDADTGSAIQEAWVIAIPELPLKKKTMLSDSNGYYEQALPEGDWWVIVFKKGYKVDFEKVTVEEAKTTRKDFPLPPKP